MKKEIFVCDICKKEFNEMLPTFKLPVLYVYDSSLPYKPQILDQTFDVCSQCSDKIGRYIYQLREDSK